MENEKVKEFIERMKRKLAEKDSVGVGDISFETTIQNNCNKKNFVSELNLKYNKKSFVSEHDLWAKKEELRNTNRL